ncbi:MAG: site-2 protease family protein, partial [Planctomycetes bacterium]|nr:site-2 protease family protein [Planctomycetota bacterium]
MSKRANSIRKTVNAIIVLAAIIAVVVFALRDPARFGRIAFVIIGFGAMIFIHELGHFLVAKNADIECHTFSLGFPPVLLGFRQTEKGWRFRILPTIFARSTDDEQESDEPEGRESEEGEQPETGDEDAEKETAILTFTIPRKCKASDTEYCIGLIPFGGYVGMLGQEDSDVPEATADPRSFTNKSIPVRMAVISAGVIFNLIGAFAIFATIAGIGIDLPPAVIGEVTADGPADKAGLVAGDEILEIAGKTKIDFTNLILASALSKKDTNIPMKVRRRDGTVEDFEVGTATIPGMKLRGFGIGQAQSLKLAMIEGDDEDVEALYAEIGLRGGDEVFAVDGHDVSAVWELDEAIEKIRKPSVMLSARRSEDEMGRTGLVNTTLDLDMAVAPNYDISDESQLYHIYSMVPRLRVTAVTTNPVSDKSRVRILFEDKLRLRGLMEKIGLAGPAVEKTAVAGGIEAGDIIVKVGEVDFPTYL